MDALASPLDYTELPSPLPSILIFMFPDLNPLYLFLLYVTAHISFKLLQILCGDVYVHGGKGYLQCVFGMNTNF